MFYTQREYILNNLQKGPLSLKERESRVHALLTSLGHVQNQLNLKFVFHATQETPVTA